MSSAVSISLIFSCSAGAVCVIGYEILKRFWPHIYQGRIYQDEALGTPPRLSTQVFSWITQVWKLSNEDIHRYAGLDVFAFLFFQQVCLRILAVSAFLALTILLPVYATGHADLGNGPCLNDITGDVPVTQDMESKFIFRLSLLNVCSGSPRMWALVAYVWLSSGVTYFLLKRAYKQISSLVKEYRQSENLPWHHTVMVHSLSGTPRQPAVLRHYFAEKFPGYVDRVIIAQDTEQVEKETQTLEYYRYCLDQARDEDAQVSVWNRCPGKLQTPEEYQQKIYVLEHSLRAKLEERPVDLKIGFVVFKTLQAANVCASICPTLEDSPDGSAEFDFLQGLTHLAPDPEDIIWENLGVPEENRGIRDIFSNSLHIVFLAFYAIPLALFTSLFNLSRLSGLSPAIARFLTNHPDLASFVSGTLASLGITLIIAILPYGVQYNVALQRPKTKSEYERMLLRKYDSALVIMIFLVTSATSTFFGSINFIVENPGNFFGYLVIAFQKSPTLHLNYMILQAFFFVPFQLLLFGNVADKYWYRKRACSWCCYPKVALYEKNPAYPVKFFYWYPLHNLALMICLTFTPMQPILAVVGVVYFVVSLAIFRYQCLYVWVPQYESGGRLFRSVFRRACVAVLIFQLTAMGAVLIKSGFAMFFSLFPLPFLTLAFWRDCQENYAPYFNTMFKDKTEAQDHELADPPDQELDSSLADAYVHTVRDVIEIHLTRVRGASESGGDDYYTEIETPQISATDVETTIDSENL